MLVPSLQRARSCTNIHILGCMWEESAHPMMVQEVGALCGEEIVYRASQKGLMETKRDKVGEWRLPIKSSQQPASHIVCPSTHQQGIKEHPLYSGYQDLSCERNTK